MSYELLRPEHNIQEKKYFFHNFQPTVVCCCITCLKKHYDCNRNSTTGQDICYSGIALAYSSSAFTLHSLCIHFQGLIFVLLQSFAVDIHYGFSLQVRSCLIQNGLYCLIHYVHNATLPTPSTPMR